MSQAQFKVCPRCKAPAPLDASVCARAGCGHQFRTVFAQPQVPDPTRAFSADELPQQVGRGEYEYPTQIEPLYPQAPQPAPPAYQPQPYQQSQPMYQQQPAEVVKTTDACAILSVVFGGLGIGLMCFGWFFAIPGLILGIISMVRIRSNPRLSGMPMAITGTALSAVPIAWGIWLMLAVSYAVSTAPPVPGK